MNRRFGVYSDVFHIWRYGQLGTHPGRACVWVRKNIDVFPVPDQLHSALSMRIVNHVKMTEHAIHFWRAGLDEKPLRTVEYPVAPPNGVEYPFNTNVVSRICCLSFLEPCWSMACVLRAQVVPAEFNASSGAESNNHDDQLTKIYTLPETGVLGVCLGIGATAKTCLVVPKYRIFITCDSDSDCVWNWRPTFLRAFAEQAQKNESDKSDSEKVQVAAKH